MAQRLLIIDDDGALNEMLQLHFADKGFEVIGATNCAAGRAAVTESHPDLILLDQQMPDGQGVDLLEPILELQPNVPIIMMTGAHNLELAIKAIKRGARDFVHKPIKTAELELSINKELAHSQLVAKVSELESVASQSAPAASGNLVGKSEAMLTVSKEIALTAASDASVLINGESGTGKEVVARAIHHYSNRDGPFVAVNSAAIVDTLLESELFGHEKGAFTGAVARKIGKFELAQNGTLFLDEIGELALPLQAKLLRVLQESEFERVGGTQTLTTNARIIAATNRDLTEEVAAKRFREDLLYRLNVVQITLPPLRERREDIPILIESLLDRISKTVHKPVLTVTQPAMQRILGYDWPGNVRELENTLTQCMVRARDTLLTPDLLTLPGQTAEAAVIGEAAAVDTTPTQTLDEVEAAYIQRVLNHTGGHKGNTCKLLAISRPALDRKIDKYQLVLNK